MYIIIMQCGIVTPCKKPNRAPALGSLISSDHQCVCVCVVFSTWTAHCTQPAEDRGAVPGAEGLQVTASQLHVNYIFLELILV